MARPEVLAFLADIKEHPLDRTTRLILADWLEERDDPRGSLVRVQCEAVRPDLDPARRQALADEERQLLSQHQETWLGCLRSRVVSFAFQRGLIQLQTTPDQLVRERDPTVIDSEELAWVETIRLYGDSATPGDYAGTRALQGACVLDCSWTRLQANHLAGLAGAAPFAFLRELILNTCNVGTTGLEALGESNSFPALVELHLASCAVDDAALACLARGTLLGRLQVLDLRNNRVGLAGVLALVNATSTGALRELSLMHNQLGDEVVPVLTRSELLQRLHLLDLRGNRFSQAGRRQFDRFGPRVRMGS